jgi:uncharacterized pyridoxamine 5'-phosphate oxidase family protein
MEKKDIIEFVRQNPVCYMATVDGNSPKVRPFLVWMADDSGIYLDTAPYKDVYKQLKGNPAVELCFHRQGEKKVLRLSGRVEFLDDPEIRKKYFGDKPDNNTTEFFVLKHGDATYWWRDETGKAHYEGSEF